MIPCGLLFLSELMIASVQKGGISLCTLTLVSVYKEKEGSWYDITEAGIKGICTFSGKFCICRRSGCALCDFSDRLCDALPVLPQSGYMEYAGWYIVYSGGTVETGIALPDILGK